MPHSRFFLADLQVHSLADDRHQYGHFAGQHADEEFACQLIDAHVQAGVQIIALSDHLNVDYWPTLARIGQEQGVWVFPAVEFNVQRCHLIVLFERTQDGYDACHRYVMNLHRPGEDLRTADGNYRAVTRAGVQDLAKEAHDAGGLVIAPHSTQSDIGFFSSGVVPDKSEIVQEGLIEAFDVVGDSHRDVLTNPRSHFGDKIPTWILTGDTRSFSDVGARAIWLKLDEPPTLEGLRQAFLSPHTRIRFPETHRDRWGHVPHIRFSDQPYPTWPRIENVHVQGGFHAGLDISLGPGLNAVIGGKGTGKSALIEAIRHAVGENPYNEDLQKTLKATLPANAELCVTVAQGDATQYAIHRIGGESADPPTLYKDGADTGLLVEQRFTVSVFGQHELRNLAEQNPLRDYIAAEVREDWNDAKEKERKALRRLQDLEGDIESLEQQVEDVQEKKRELADIADRVEKAEKAGAQTKISTLQSLTKDDRTIREARTWPETVRKAAQQLRQLDAAPTPPQREAIREAMGEKLAELRSEVDAAADRLEGAADDAKQAVDEVASEWKTWYEARVADINQELAQLGLEKPEQLAEDQRRKAELEGELSKAGDREQALATLISQRESALNDLEAARRELSRVIVEGARRLNERVSPKVRIDVDPLSDYSECLEQLRETVPHIRRETLERGLRMASTPRRFAGAIREGAEALNALGVTDSAISRLGGLEAGVVRRIEEAEVADTVILRLNLGESDDGDWHPVDEVSPGQKATALLTLALAGGEEPLIIDQPEDDLDNRYIFEEVVKVICDVCSKRQVIVATHNANIPILGDAECVLALDATSDRGSVLALGGLEDAEVSHQARQILEGGDQAFRARQERYSGSSG